MTPEIQQINPRAFAVVTPAALMILSHHSDDAWRVSAGTMRDGNPPGDLQVMCLDELADRIGIYADAPRRLITQSIGHAMRAAGFPAHAAIVATAKLREAI